jgi:hypothetical protein
MHDYVPDTLARFQHPTPTKPQHSPHAWLKPVYDAAPQMTAPPTPATYFRQPKSRNCNK